MIPRIRLQAALVAEAVTTNPAFLWLRKWWWIIVGVWLISVSIALLIIAFGVRSTGERQEVLAQAAKTQAEDIQAERAEGYRKSCEDQNSRNRKAVARLHQFNGNPEAIRRTVLLIDAIVPVKDCEELAKSRVRSR